LNDSHRLSTITTADQILVLHQGAVAESGTHEELLALKSRYATMWRKQIRAEEAARSALIVPSCNISPKNGSINGEVSENESEASSGTARSSPSGITGSVLALTIKGR
jgi:ABC-type multidrug transport system ATPase subunit